MKRALKVAFSWGRELTGQPGGVRRGLLSLLLGTGVAQLVSVGAVPLISRLYLPEDYGQLTLVTSLAGIVAPVAALRFDAAAMLPRKRGVVSALAWNALLSSTLVTLILGVTLWGVYRSGLSSLDDYPFVYLWVPATTFATSLYAVFSQFALRERMYNLVAFRTTTQSVVGRGTQVLFGLFHPTSSSLLLGNLLGRVFGIATVARRIRWVFTRPTLSVMASSARTYWRFPTIFSLSTLLNTLGLLAPVAFFNLVLGPSEGGQVAMASTIVAIPVMLVGNTAAQLVEAEFAQRIRNRSGPLGPQFVKYSFALSVLGVFVLAVFGLGGPTLADVFLGENWKPAGSAIQIMAVTSSVRLVVMPLSKIMLLLQRSSLTLGLDLFRVILVGTGMWVSGGLRWSVEASLWSVYGGLAVTYLITWLILHVVISDYDVALSENRM